MSRGLVYNVSQFRAGEILKKSSGLGDFIVAEMQKRDLSLRKFAELVGVNHSTLSKHINGEIEKPGLDFLVSLSVATQTNLQTLVAYSYPEIADRMNVNPDMLLLAQRLDRLPEDLKEFILSKAGV